MDDVGDVITNHYDHVTGEDSGFHSNQDKETDDYICSEIIQSVMASLYSNSNDDTNYAAEVVVQHEENTSVDTRAESLEGNDGDLNKYNNTSNDGTDDIRIDNDYINDVPNDPESVDVRADEDGSGINMDEIMAGIYGKSFDDIEEVNDHLEQLASADVNDEEKGLEMEVSALLENIAEEELEKEEDLVEGNNNGDQESEERRVSFSDGVYENVNVASDIVNVHVEVDRKQFAEYSTTQNDQVEVDRADFDYVNEAEDTAQDFNNTEQNDALYENVEDGEETYDEVYVEVKEEIQASTAVPDGTADTQANENVEIKELAVSTGSMPKKPQSQSSGKFLMRAVVKANPHHVIRCVTDNQSQSSDSQHNPEQDELVMYLKGESTEISGVRDRLKSLITSPLIQQFNKEAESGNEVGQAFFPKFVAVSGPRPSGTNTKVDTEATVKEESETGKEEPVEALISPKESGQRKIEAISDPQSRNAEIAKAIQAADFKPSAVKHTVRQTSASTVPKANAATVEPAHIAQGISIYSKQPYKISKDESTSSASNTQGNAITNGDRTPDWKAEIQKRKMANEFLAAQKPPEPIKLAEIPEWKRVLMEKQKLRKESASSDDNNNNVPNDIGTAEQVQWKKEIRQILKQKEKDQQEQEIPEWQRIANSKI